MSLSKKIIDFVKPLECQQSLGLENGTISDGQMSSSSQLDDAHAAMQARLNSKAAADKGGSWSAGKNDSRQWLHVDLGNQNTNVTRVATQGRNNASQWVTKYKLQYSEDGVNYQYYREPGETVDKVTFILSQTRMWFLFQLFDNHTSFKLR